MADEEKGLERKFRKAQESGDRDAYKAAKAEFAAARTARKRREAGDPSHPRQIRSHAVGVSKGTVTLDDGTVLSGTEER